MATGSTDRTTSHAGSWASAWDLATGWTWHAERRLPAGPLPLEWLARLGRHALVAGQVAAGLRRGSAGGASQAAPLRGRRLRRPFSGGHGLSLRVQDPDLPG